MTLSGHGRHRGSGEIILCFRGRTSSRSTPCGRGDGADGSGGVVSARNSLIARSFRRKRDSGTGCPPSRQNKSLFEALDVLRFNELNRKSVSEVSYHAADHFSDGERRPDLGYDVGGNGR